MERDKDMRAVTVHEVLDSTLEAVAHVETVAVEAARRVGFRGVSLDHISLATHETTTNAVSTVIGTGRKGKSLLRSR